MDPVASVIVPTRERPPYLEVTLSSIAPQAREQDAEVVVVDDAAEARARAAAERHGVRYLAHPEPRGPNAARNTGFQAARAELLVLVDDDVEAPPGWLAALLAAAQADPGADVLGGPIRVRLEGSRLRMCGREGPPITFLDLGPEDREAEFVWSANMALRRRALERAGPFDAALDIYGDEEEWQRRHRAAGGRTRYVAGAGLVHRRAGADARLPALSRSAYRRGRNSRRFDVRKGTVPALASETRVLAGCVLHAIRFGCGNGVVLTAQSAGRMREALRPAGAAGASPHTTPAGALPPAPDPAGSPAETEPSPLEADFLSGRSGTVAGRRAQGRALALDAIADGWALLGARRHRLVRAAGREPARRRVLVLGIERPEIENLMDAARAELLRSRHDVTLAIGTAGGRGKFENLNALLAAHPPEGHDWLLVVDDDVTLPPGFLDGLLFLAERFDLRMTQPAHRHRSHAAWPVTRRRAATVVRETGLVEIGPVTALHADTFADLLPFPPLRMGWGLDAHWAAVARARGWRAGVVDALPVQHGLRPVAGAYASEDAIEEGRAFLATRPYLRSEELSRTMRSHRRW
jgi:GT2 family glycosyltransferase